MKRILSTILLISGLFFIPWIFVYAAVFLASAAFSWYIEAFLVGFAASLIADAPFWKIFLILALTIFIQEKFKASLNFSRPGFAVLWLWFIGFLSSGILFFVLV